MAAKLVPCGPRGPATELTDDVISAHATGFICAFHRGSVCPRDGIRIHFAELANAAMHTTAATEMAISDFGEVPRPAFALAAMIPDAATAMITESRIPADPKLLGERIVRHSETGLLAGMELVQLAYDPLHRGLIGDALHALGAKILELDRSQTFIPLDTKGVPAWTRDEVFSLKAQHRSETLVSSDSDSDRTLVAEEWGGIFPDNLLGQMAPTAPDADTVVAPVSFTMGVELSERFGRVLRIRLGSPIVIADMEPAEGWFVGYEIMDGFNTSEPAGPIPAFTTRDRRLPIVGGL